MTWKIQPIFRDHVRGKLPDIPYFTVFPSWLALTHFKTMEKWWGFLEWGLLHFITRSIGEMMYETSFTKLHSQKKEMQLSNFMQGRIFVTLHVLKHLSIAREPWTILKQGFLHIVSKTIGKLKCTTKFTYLHSSQKETQLSTVRFFWDRVYICCTCLLVRWPWETSRTSYILIK